MQQIYRRTPMPKCDLNKVALQLYWNHTSAWVLACKFAFSWEHLWRATSKLMILDAWKFEKYYHALPAGEPQVSNANAFEIFEIFLAVRSTDDL